MSGLVEIKQRLNRLESERQQPIISALVGILAGQDYRARLSHSTVKALCEQYRLMPIALALHCISLAACYALVPVSRFYVGAVAVGESGDFYFGANQEFARQAMQQTVHAEQSAISHAWIAGETGISDVVVNYTPCGHCRQFMNELNRAETLKVHLPHRQDQRLQDYLPDSFGPKDLNITQVLFDERDLGVPLTGDRLQQAAIKAMNHSYAPYSQAFSGVALQAGPQIVIGRYAENAAFNPSFLPLQSALNFYRLNAVAEPIERLVFCEKRAVLSHQAITASLASTLNCPAEYIEIP